jgi:hypothetical protein
LFFFKSYVASYGYVRRPGTDRISEEVKKKLRRNSNRDSCGKSATGTENTGIRRIPAGICNLDRGRGGIAGGGRTGASWWGRRRRRGWVLLDVLVLRLISQGRGGHVHSARLVQPGRDQEVGRVKELVPVLPGPQGH